ncbi:hypothetical protein GCM10025876_38270 [Demequina litorisediminis]|uniref:Uncharacterized protein n=1 Tax=Demequina litorisediminis TaxID=1849022 RepID=A0ABQ6ILR6_9MICO|nr:hypothetical protein GCM10025876_38270 [Demequina litorisediminis]
MCKGAGVTVTDLGPFDSVETLCEECEGRRFQASVLEHTLGGKNIAEVLRMSVAQAEEFFGAGDGKTPTAHRILERMKDVGLGYLKARPTAHDTVRRRAPAPQAWPRG